MIHRFFNRGGAWHRPAHLNAADFTNFPFAINWSNLNQMFSLRKYYSEIAPPFSKAVAHRCAEMERLHDDLVFYHVRRSYYMLIGWVLFTTFGFDWDDIETPGRHWRTDSQGMWPHSKIRSTHMREEK
jgi:hypothetical protein